MPQYDYKAKNIKGDFESGEIIASNVQEVMSKLRGQKLVPVQVTPKTISRSFAAKGLVRGKKVKGKDLQIFTRQLSTLINAGIPVVDSLRILGDGLREGPLKEASLKVRSSIEEGRRLADSMALCPLVFDKLYINMIQAGEEAGILDVILGRLAIYMEKSEKLKSQVKGAMVYPAVIMVVAILVIAGILIFIIPRFQEFYSAAGKEPPALTQFVVNLSHSLVNNWYYYLGVLISVPFSVKAYIETKEGRIQFDKFIIWAPVIGQVIQKSSLARLTRTLSTLISSGVGLIDAIDIAARTGGNYVIEEALSRCKESVTQGKAFAAPLAKEKVIPPMVTQMIAIGEKSGTMDMMLSKIADFYEDEVENAVKAMTSLIEPMMMVFLGGIIAILVVAMYLPIFSMGDVVGSG